MNNILTPDTNGMYVGAEIEIFGMTGTITIVEPYSDWSWNVEVVLRTVGHVDDEILRMVVPSDFHTTTGMASTPAAARLAAEWEQEAADAADDRMHRMESMACDR